MGFFLVPAWCHHSRSFWKDDCKNWHRRGSCGIAPTKTTRRNILICRFRLNKQQINIGICDSICLVIHRLVQFRREDYILNFFLTVIFRKQSRYWKKISLAKFNNGRETSRFETFHCKSSFNLFKWYVEGTYAIFVSEC